MPAAVIDNGTGYTKLGFAGNTEPQFIIPSCKPHPVIFKIRNAMRNLFIWDIYAIVLIMDVTK
jgi:actin-related protein